MTCAAQVTQGPQSPDLEAQQESALKALAAVEQRVQEMTLKHAVRNAMHVHPAALEGGHAVSQQTGLAVIRQTERPNLARQAREHRLGHNCPANACAG